jgi:hypothetical protein
LSVLAERQGLTDEHIMGLVDKPAGLFTQQELVALELAETLFRADAGAAGADPALLDRLRSHFRSS